MENKTSQDHSPITFNLMATIVIISVAYFFSNFQRLVLAVLGEGVVADFGLTDSQLALLGSAIFYPYAFLQIPAGYIGDTVSARKLIFTSCLVSGAGALIFAFATGFSGLITGRLIASAGTAFAYVPALAILRREFGDKRYGTMAGMYMALGSFGSLAAATPLRIISEYVSREAIFIFIGGVTLAAGIGAAVLISDKKSTAQKRPLAQVLKSLATPGFLAVVLYSMTSGGTTMSFSSLWGGRFFTQSLELSPRESSVCLMMLSMGSLVGGLVGGRVVAKLGTIRTLWIFATLRSLCWCALGAIPASSSASLVAAECFISGAIHICASTAMFASVRLFVPPENTGIASGCINCAIFIGSGLLTQLSVAIMSAAGGSTHDQFFALLAVFGGLMFISCSIVALVNRKQFIEKS